MINCNNSQAIGIPSFTPHLKIIISKTSASSCPITHSRGDNSHCTLRNFPIELAYNTMALTDIFEDTDAHEVDPTGIATSSFSRSTYILRGKNQAGFKMSFRNFLVGLILGTVTLAVYPALWDYSTAGSFVAAMGALGLFLGSMTLFLPTLLFMDFVLVFMTVFVLICLAFQIMFSLLEYIMQ
eukprot:1128157_1